MRLRLSARVIRACNRDRLIIPEAYHENPPFVGGISWNENSIRRYGFLAIDLIGFFSRLVAV